MSQPMLEVVCRSSGGGRAKVMPLVGELVVGSGDDCDWPFDPDDCGGTRVTLLPLGEHVRIDPMGRALRVRGHRPLSAPRLLRVPVRFVLGVMEFEVRIAGIEAQAEGPIAGDFDRLVAAAKGELGAAADTGTTTTALAKAIRTRRGQWVLGGFAVLAAAGTVGLALVVSIFSKQADASPVRLATVAPAPAVRTGPGSLTDGYADGGRVDAHERLRRRVEALLRSAEIEPDVVFKVDATGPVLTGEATSEDIDRVNRIVTRVAREDPLFAELRVSISPRNAGGSLPFRIEQVVGGSAPFIVLDDGTTLEPGQRHEGVTLVAIQGHRIVLQGARRIEVDW